MNVAVYGPPGVGKTTLAMPLADRLGATYVSSGDIARRVDPNSVALGTMADVDKLRDGFRHALDAAPGPVVIDGLPRYPFDVDLLPEGTIPILLICWPAVAERRQLERGRPGDTPMLTKIRTREQYAIMELDREDGWAYELAGPGRVIETGPLGPDVVFDLVVDILIRKGAKNVLTRP